MKIVKVQPTTLKYPFGPNDTSFTVKSFVDSKGKQVTLANFGLYFVTVIKQGTTSEMVLCNAITANLDGSSTITVATTGRDIDASYPYASYSIGQEFEASAEVQITNDPLTMSTFPNLEEVNTFKNNVTFNINPSTNGGDPVGANDLARRAWVLSVINGGTVSTDRTIVPGIGAVAITAGQLIYLDTPTYTWFLCDAHFSAKVDNITLGIAQGSSTVGGAITGGVLIRGLDNHQTSLIPYSIYYASNTAGAISLTVGTTSVTLGVAKSTTELFFDPRYDTTVTRAEKNSLATILTFPGVVLPYAGRSAPLGWLLCDGSAISRTTYANLFTILVPSITVTLTIASPTIFTTSLAHGLVAGDRLHFRTTGGFPSGLNANTDYYVITAGLTSTSFEISLVKGGTPVITTGSQSGIHTVFISNFGRGDGSTTFNIPDMRRRNWVGVGTPSSVPFNFDPTLVGGNQITVPDTDTLYQGQAVVYTTSGTAITGLSPGTTYYVIRVDSTHISLANNITNAGLATIIPLTSSGVGIQTLTSTVTSGSGNFGELIGEDFHGMGVNEMANHQHVYYNQGSNTVYSTPATAISGNNFSGGNGTSPTSYVGGNVLHNNMPPGVVGNYIIKT